MTKILYIIWNFLPLFLQRFIKKFLLKKQNKSLIINNNKIYDSFLLTDILNKKVNFWKNVFLWQKDTSFFWKIEIWDYTFIWLPNNWLYSCENFTIKIWKFCSIAKNLFIINYNSHNIEKISTSTSAFENIKYNQDWWDIIIGNDVWIGANVSILPWVKIWHWAVIGTGSVVVKDIPDYAVAVWNPAKVVKYRFDEKTIQKLLDTKWWNWDLKKIEKNYNLEFIENND